MSESLLWVEKYRPKTIEDCILPESIKKTLRDVVSQNKIPNMMFTGTSGIGKTTAARAICNETQADYLIINGSDEGRMIDTLRTKLTQFCSTISLSGSRKVVIIDEADYMNADSVQPAMRNFTERFADNCSFIFTCNYKNRIIEPIHSRCAVIDFSLKNGEKQVIAARFMKRVESILSDESIDYDKEVIAKLVLKHFPDFRRVLNELQRYSTSGEINSGVLANIKEMNLKELIDSLREKNFSKMRQWVVANVDNDPATVYRKIYDELYNVVDKGSIPQAVLTIESISINLLLLQTKRLTLSPVLLS